MENYPKRIILDLATIHDARNRLFGLIFAREVEVQQLEDPSFAIEVPETEEELMAAVRELEELRQAHTEERLRRGGEFTAYWNVSAMIDEMENDAIKQQED